MDTNVDVVVVGAGLSGLCAARRLRERGHRVAVVEARDRVGGRTLSHTVGGQTVDLGAQWIGPTQDRVAALTRELGVRTFAQYTKGGNLMDLDGCMRRYRGTIPRLPIWTLLELQVTIFRFDRLSRRLPLGAAHAATKAASWDAMSVGAWMRKHVRCEQSQRMLDIALRSILAVEPNEVSFLYWLHYLRSAGSLSLLTDTRGGAQQDRFLGGSQQLSLRLAERLEGYVHLGCPVTAIHQNDDGVIVEAGERRWSAQSVILALAPALCHRIRFEPDLPVARLALHEGMPMGSVIKCIAAYERPFWREAGLSGAVISHGGTVGLVFDDTSADGGHAALVCFLLGESARRMHLVDPLERRSTVLADLVRYFGPQAAEPLDYVDQDWLGEEWSAGCYVGVMPPGLMTEVGSALRDPVGRIHFAGTEVATRWAGYLDGAIESGERAADEVHARLGSPARNVRVLA